MKLISIILIALALLLFSCGKNSGSAPSLSVVQPSNSSGSGSSGTPTPTPTCTTCKIFVSNATTDGYMGANEASALANADSICNNDSNKPAGSTLYKAVLSSSTRVSTNGALKANTSYYRTDGTTLIGSTNSYGSLSFPFSNSVSTSSFTVWTGMNTSYGSIGPTCSNWTTNSNGSGGHSGLTNYVNSRAIYMYQDVCNNSNHLMCAEQ